MTFKLLSLELVAAQITHFIQKLNSFFLGAIFETISLNYLTITVQKFQQAACQLVILE